jgi:hypothetical protein
MKPSTREFWREFLQWPKRKHTGFQFTVRLPLWVMTGAAIAASTPYWIGSAPDLLAAALFLWALIGLAMAITNRL